ncbi:MAG: xanthine dehydrogenase family protein subunit M [Gemmatimonadaceae bacterium]|nr:xanthine dehydrogenase family protein subunit M [Gemmatimonadaceae bacterium]
MHPFTYYPAITLDDALARIAEPRHVPIGGGTDLLVTIAEQLADPVAVVDVRALEGMLGIASVADGGLRIGASVRLADIAAHDLVRSRFPALASACEQVGTPAIREMATLGGNLCQRPRCWYFRRNIPCLKNGGSGCPAREGENQYLAILEGDPCFIVHPSDPAVALVALDATIEIACTKGRRDVLASEFYVLPRERLDRETVLEDGELVIGIRLPGAAAGGLQRYVKLMQRDAWDFALASLAAVRRVDGEVRLVLGGVGPRPYRIYTSVEEEATSGGLDEETIAGLAERALLDADPLSKNGYKVTMAATLLRDAIRELAAE